MGVRVDTGVKMLVRFSVQHPPYEKMTADERSHLGLPEPAEWAKLGAQEQKDKLVGHGFVDQFGKAHMEGAPA